MRIFLPLNCETMPEPSFDSTMRQELWYNLEEQNLTVATQPQGAVVYYVSMMEGLLDLVLTTLTQNEQEIKRTFATAAPEHAPMLALVEAVHRETHDCLYRRGMHKHESPLACPQSACC